MSQTEITSVDKKNCNANTELKENMPQSIVKRNQGVTRKK